MITLKKDCLEFRFDEVHPEARCTINFQRTLRIPDDGKDYPLPPGFGSFPLRHLDDYAECLPERWRSRGGVIAPIHQAEALWISFSSDYPFAIKVATGKICAISGDSWVKHLNTDPQDYVMLPDQPWLDGYCIEKGVIRQFVAMPLGKGFTVEEQLTAAAVHGGLQLVAYPMKAERYEALSAETEESIDWRIYSASCLTSPMGLAPGGRMQQQINDDSYGLDAWDQRHSSRCFVTLLNSSQWMAVTGEQPPTAPPTAQDYAQAGMPWFDYYGGDIPGISGSKKLRGLTSVAEHAAATGQPPLPDNETVNVNRVVKLRRSSQVREGTAV